MAAIAISPPRRRRCRLRFRCCRLTFRRYCRINILPADAISRRIAARALLRHAILIISAFRHAFIDAYAAFAIAAIDIYC